MTSPSPTKAWVRRLEKVMFWEDSGVDCAAEKVFVVEWYLTGNMAVCIGFTVQLILPIVAL